MSNTIETAMIKDWLTYDSKLEFEVIYSRSGVARIFIGDRKTSFTAGGYGYCKESSVIASMINELIGYRNYDANVYGNSRAYNSKTGKSYAYKAYLSGGTGFDSIKRSFDSLKGCKLEKIYSGNQSDVYSLKVSKKIKEEVKKNNLKYYEARMSQYGY